MHDTQERSSTQKQWDLSTFFSNYETWKNTFEDLQGSFLWAIFETPQTIASANELATLLRAYFSLKLEIERLYTWAHLKNDEQLKDPLYKDAYTQMLFMNSRFSLKTAWLEPAILAAPATLLNEPAVASWKIYLERIVRARPHTLDHAQEAIIARASKALMTPYNAFRNLNDVDLTFPTISDSQGNTHELSISRYSLFTQSPDRLLRKNAFITLHTTFRNHANTLCELLAGNCQAHAFEAAVRHFSSCRHAALFANEVDEKVYDVLIKTVHEEIDALHKWVAVKKRLLKVDALQIWDLGAPIGDHKIELDYEAATQLVIDSVAPLGEAYQTRLRQGLLEEGWVDPFENKFKRSGAYSSGCYSSYPYILMNYKGLVRDVYTLAHEAGHSMHSELSRKNLPYHYANYSIFVAEVASTLNEQLLFEHWMAIASPQDQIVLLHERLQDIRATLFRQTMFAEFELKIHEWVENDESLTPERLNAEYARLNAFYFGEELVIDPSTHSEWARIPHYYYNFYVYQYATGISAALTLAKNVPKDPSSYLEFLSSGSTLAPVELLTKAGVDLMQPEAIKEAIKTFRDLTEQLSLLVKD